MSVHVILVCILFIELLVWLCKSLLLSQSNERGWIYQYQILIPKFNSFQNLYSDITISIIFVVFVDDTFPKLLNREGGRKKEKNM